MSEPTNKVDQIADDTIVAVLDVCVSLDMSNAEIDAVLITTAQRLIANLTIATEMPEVWVDEQGERL